jgi:hypothetical protein
VKEIGYIEGQNLAVEYSAQGQNHQLLAGIWRKSP